MSKSGFVRVDPLFLGLTRPPMFLGVGVRFVILNGFGSLMLFINTQNIWALALMCVIHLIAYIISFNEPLFLEIFFVKMTNFNKCKNKIYHGTNSYDPF